MSSSISSTVGMWECGSNWCAGTDKVQLINTPMIMSKYLGESEKAVQALFEPAEASVQHI